MVSHSLSSFQALFLASRLVRLSCLFQENAPPRSGKERRRISNVMNFSATCFCYYLLSRVLRGTRTSTHREYRAGCVIRGFAFFKMLSIRRLTSSQTGVFALLARTKLKEDMRLLSENRPVSSVPRTTTEDIFECSFCSKISTENWVLNRHHRIHTGVTPYECRYCQIGFYRIDTMSAHERCHTNALFICDYCDKAFADWLPSSIHGRIHTGIKAYKCRSCPQIFNQWANRRRHEKWHYQ